jgi:hypothetical protein
MRTRAIIIGIASLILLGSATAVIAQVATAVPQVQVHGFLLARTIVTNNNYGARIDRYGLRILQKVDDEFDLLTEVYIHPSEADARSRVYMESAFLNWHLKNRLPWDFNVRIGKGRNFCYGIAPSYANRRTSDYTLYSESFTQLRVTGFQTFSNFGKAQLALAIVNPYTQSSRMFPDFPIGNAIPIPICDRDNDTIAIKNRVGVSGRLGYKTTMLNVGASGYMSQTGPDKVGGVKQKNTRSRFGLDGEIKLENGLMAQGQVTMATTASDLNKNAADGLEKDLSHNGGEVLVGWENWTAYKAGLYARYGMLTYDDKLQGLNQIMVSAVYKIRPNIHLRLEGLINGEDEDKAKGWVKCNNDVLFFETCFEW